MIPASTSFSTSACIALVRSGACPLFFCRTGEHPSRTLSLCSATDRGTPVMSEVISRELRILTIPSSVGNLSIPWRVDGTAWIAFNLDRPMMT
nr:hypothetical protein [Tanacetum cinerariifolium]